MSTAINSESFSSAKNCMILLTTWQNCISIVGYRYVATLTEHLRNSRVIDEMEFKVITRLILTLLSYFSKAYTHPDRLSSCWNVIDPYVGGQNVISKFYFFS